MNKIVGALCVAALLSGCAAKNNAAFVAPDKQKHIAAGAITSSVVYTLTKDRLSACVAALGVGVFKEVYDAQGYGNVEVADALATGVGCSVVFTF